MEITNVCNLNCIFCPKTKRKPATMTPEQFEQIINKIKGHVRFLYFHLMGEPFMHQHLPHFIGVAKENNLVPVLTTNGTVLRNQDQIIEAQPHKIQVSLHSFEGNTHEGLETYIKGVADFALKASQRGIIMVLRLWNEGGYNQKNEQIVALLRAFLPMAWTRRDDGWKIDQNLYLEYDKMFEWPDMAHRQTNEPELFCYALRNQIGILVDGTVVPCCLDHDGDIALGNILDHDLPTILESDRARALYDSFTHHKAIEPLCQRCGYAAVTKRFRK